MSCSVPALFTITVEIEAHFNRQHFSNLLLLNFGEFSPTHTSWATTYVSCSPSFLFLADRRGPQALTAVFHLLQLLTCFVFREGFLIPWLQTMFV